MNKLVACLTFMSLLTLLSCQVLEGHHAFFSSFSRIDNTNNVLLFLFQKGTFIRLYKSAIRSIIDITDLNSKLKFHRHQRYTCYLQYPLSAFATHLNLKIQMMKAFKPNSKWAATAKSKYV